MEMRIIYKNTFDNTLTFEKFVNQKAQENNSLYGKEKTLIIIKEDWDLYHPNLLFLFQKCLLIFLVV